MALPYGVLIVTIFLIGVCTVGAQTGMNAMGWALGVGGIGGPWIGGMLFAWGLPPRQIFLVTCVTASIATITLIAVSIQGRKRARMIQVGNPLPAR